MVVHYKCVTHTLSCKSARNCDVFAILLHLVLPSSNSSQISQCTKSLPSSLDSGRITLPLTSGTLRHEPSPLPPIHVSGPQYRWYYAMTRNHCREAAVVSSSSGTLLLTAILTFVVGRSLTIPTQQPRGLLSTMISRFVRVLVPMGRRRICRGR